MSPAPQWTPACSLDQLPVGGSRVFREDGLQVAILRVDHARIFAVDNRCPHEGYPLAQGEVKVGERRCVLTCAWHNYKFELETGAATIGEEAVRTFPVRVVDGTVEVDLAPPDPAVERARLRRSIEGGLLERQLGRVARDVVRFLAAGGTPEEVALIGAALDGARARWGTTHALPVAADALRLAQTLAGSARAHPLVQALDMAAESVVRRPRRERPEPAVLPEAVDPAAHHAAVRAAVEAEDAAEAEAGFAAGLARFGRRWALELLAALCADHLLDFGHGLIYVVKAAELLAAADAAGVLQDDDEQDVLCGLLYGLLTATREDLLPAWRSTRAVIEGTGVSVGAVCTVEGLARQVADLSGGKPAAAVRSARAQGMPLDDILGALELAASWRLLRFDIEIDRDMGVQDGWLSVSHALTRAQALRLAVERDLLAVDDLDRCLMLTARFVAHGKVLDLPEAQRRRPEPEPATAGEVVAAVLARDPELAVDRAAGALATEPAALEAALAALGWADVLTRAITVAHAIKTVVAAFDAWRASGRPEPVLGTVRFLAGVSRERRVAQRTAEAIALVERGAVPKLLAH